MMIEPVVGGAAAVGGVSSAHQRCEYASAAGHKCKKMSPLAYCPVHMCTICRSNSKSSKTNSCSECVATAVTVNSVFRPTSNSAAGFYEDPVTFNPLYARASRLAGNVALDNEAYVCISNGEYLPVAPEMDGDC